MTQCKMDDTCQLKGKSKGNTYMCYNSQLKDPDGKIKNNSYWSKKGQNPWNNYN